MKKHNKKSYQAHVTMVTNQTMEEAVEYLNKLDSCYIIEICKPKLRCSKRIYLHDPLDAWVIDVRLKDLGGRQIFLGHQPHITLAYGEHMDENPPPITPVELTVYANPKLVDTRGLKPHKWKILS